MRWKLGELILTIQKQDKCHKRNKQQQQKKQEKTFPDNLNRVCY